jgi:hypothetical protein
MADWSGGGKGALGGAATGAAIGSVAGPYGAAVGGVIGGIGGGIAGLFGGGGDDENSRRLEEYRRQVLERGGAEVGPAAQGSTSDFRSNQQGLIARLEALSNGTGPSLAGEQLRQATDRNMAQQQSIAQSGHGNATLANLVAANNSQNLGQAAAQQAAIARIAETQAATQQLGTTLGQARQQDEQSSQFNAQQQNFASQANLEARLRLMGLNDSSILSIMQQQTQNAQRPGLGDQILAGGVGALGMLASQRNASRANANSGQVAPMTSPMGGTLWDTSAAPASAPNGWNFDRWARNGGAQ